MAPKNDFQKIYPLTPLQEGMLFHTLRDRDAQAYFEQMSFTIQGVLDITAFERSLNELIKRYEVFRTNFVYQKLQKPRQVVFKEKKAEITYKDLSISGYEKKEAIIKDYERRDREKGFDLTRDLLMRVSVLKVGPESYHIIWSHHHILMDGWCTSVILKEFFVIYEALKNGQEPVLSEVYPFSQYIEWLEKQDKQEAAQYWKEHLTGYEEQAVIPKYRSKGENSPYIHGEKLVIISSELTNALEELARQNQVTFNTLFQTLWGVLLQKYNQTDDVVFGAVVSGRPPEIVGIENMIGLFINTIPVRIQCHPEVTFARLMRKVQQTSFLSAKYDYFSLAEIQAETALKQDLIDNIVAFQNMTNNETVTNGQGTQVEFAVTETKIFAETHYDFSVTVIPGANMILQFNYNGYVYDDPTMERLGGHIREIMQAVVNRPQIPIRAIGILTVEEKKQLLTDFNRSEFSYPKNKPLHQLFEEQVAKTPEAVAVVYGEQRLTYRQLNDISNRLARALRKKGVTSDTPVAVLLERSVEMLIAIYSILKAGGGYVPIDPLYPPQRVKAMLSNSEVPVIIPQERMVELAALGEGSGSQTAVSEPRAPIQDFDRLPFPDRSFIDLTKYRHKIGMAGAMNCISLQTTRGCPYQCIYCHKVWSKTHVYRSAENIFQEIESYYRRGVSNFAIIDDCFNLQMENGKKLFRMIIDRKMKMQLFFPNGLRGDLLTPEYIDLMIEAGVVNINLSLETASPRLQKLIKKNLNLERFRQIVDYIASKHDRVILELATMHGFPTETEEEALETLEFIKTTQWIHFPYVHILKVYPNTEMEELALAHGVSREAINNSAHLAYHEIPETLPFPKHFTRRYQAEFLNEYFLSKERLRAILPTQLRILQEEALLEKYRSYLPVEIQSLGDLLQAVGLEDLDLSTAVKMEPPTQTTIFDFPPDRSQPDSEGKRILLLDLSLHFSSQQMLYKVVEQPLGLIYLMTYLKEQFGEKIDGRIYKSGVDFDSFAELRELVTAYQPEFIGIRTLSLFREFFHETVRLLRQWGVSAPIVTGGPYATSEYTHILTDPRVDLVILGEGEETFRELIGMMLESEDASGVFCLPPLEVLRKIPGLAFPAQRKAMPEIILISGDMEPYLVESGENLDSITNEEDLVYQIYTSGSTGIPKGVMVKSHAFVNLLNWFNTEFQINADDRILLVASVSFDLAQKNLFSSLLKGGQLHLFPGATLDYEQMAGIIAKERITIVNCTPSAFYPLLEFDERMNYQRLQTLRYVFLGGEPIQMARLSPWLGSPACRCEVVNTYGPTECTDIVSFYRITDEDQKAERIQIPIGKPVHNTHLYVLGKNKEFLPVGIPGELYAGGVGLAKGYHGDDELTVAKFLAIPDVLEPMVYRTGDLVKWLPDGNLEFLGRMDHQVKVRGFRIELGEIESVLLKHQEVKEAVVVVREEENSGNYLCAYLITDQPVEVSRVREYLKESLPEYMVPSYFIMLDEFPLTPSGKIDRKRLPDPHGLTIGGGEEASPRNETEAKLATIWQDILGIPRVGINDNFFECGGQSLKATALIARIHKEFDVELPLGEVFRAPVLKNLAQIILVAEKSKYVDIKPAPDMEYYPVSSAQKRLYLLYRFDRQSVNYNMPIILRFDDKLDPARLTGAFRLLMRRHDILRTSFHMVNGEVVQKIHPDPGFQLDIREVPETEVDKRVAAFTQPFDLNQPSLVRISLLDITGGGQVLLMDMHHIISDGVTLQILIRDIIDLYQGKDLPELRITYKDYACWQQATLSTEYMKRQEAFWMNMYHDGIPQLKMALDFDRPVTQTFHGKTLDFNMDREIVTRLTHLARRSNTTINHVWHAIYSVLLFLTTSQEEIIVGNTVAGRSHVDLENVAGVFINFLPVKLHISSDKTFLSFLAEASSLLIRAYENQDYPFDLLVEHYSTKLDRSRNPFFDTMINFHNEFGISSSSEGETNGLRLSGSAIKNDSSTLDMKFDLYPVQSGEMTGTLEYNANLFKEETMWRFIENLCHLAELVGMTPEVTLSSIQLRTESRPEEPTPDNHGEEMEQSLTLAVAATFTADPIQDAIGWWCNKFGVKLQIQHAPYNQVFQELLSESGLISTNTGANLVLVRFEDWIREDFSKEETKIRKMEENFEALVEILENKSRKVPYFVGIFPTATHLGHSDRMKAVLDDLYTQWENVLGTMDNVYTIDFRSLDQLYQLQTVFDPGKDQKGHIPFSDEFYAAMGTMVARQMIAWKRQIFKVVAVDCDNTLWRGICGEDGALGVQIEETHRALQQFLSEQRRKGMLLVLCSKNNEADVWEVFDRNPGMLLKKEEITACRINWNPKSQSLKELAMELNLGLDSFIFMDDSPVECAEIMTNRPEVLTIPLPEKPEEWMVYLAHNWAFDRLKVTAEDMRRADMYREEQQRREVETKSCSLEDFLTGLSLKVSMNVMDETEAPRVAQMTQRTNQFNLSTIRRTEEQIAYLLNNPAIKCHVIEVEDRFGAYGLVGVVITERKNRNLFIDTLLLSCRVLGREVEMAVLAGLKYYAGEENLDRLDAIFVPTAKNKPVEDFLRRTGWVPVETSEKSTHYTLEIEQIPDRPGMIEFFYGKPLTRKTKAETSSETTVFSPLRGLPEKAYTGSRWDMKVVNEEQLFHRHYLLPMENAQGSSLIQLLAGEAPARDGQRPYTPPGTEVEKTLVAIWERLLNVNGIGIDDDFYELGGNSLLAIKLEVEIDASQLPIQNIDLYRDKTIRQLALAISGETSVEPVGLKETAATSQAVAKGPLQVILEDIHPFNDIFYRNCFYNSAFPVLRHFNRSVLSFLINDVVTYHLHEETRNLSMVYKPCRSIPEIMAEEGIEVQMKLTSTDIIADIKAAIQRERPVIIWVDCFYEPIRPEMYQQTHWAHTWLIFGYDDAAQTCHLIEHRHRDNLTYEKRLIRYEDVINCYQGFLTHFRHDERFTSFFEFSPIVTVSPRDRKEEHRNIYINNMLAHREVIKTGLANLACFTELFQERVMEESLIKNWAPEVLRQLNEVITAKQVENYRLRELFDNVELMKLPLIILENWSMVRSAVAKFIYSSLYKPEVFKEANLKLTDICRLENEYFDLLSDWK